MATGVYINKPKLKAAIPHGAAKQLAENMGMHSHSFSRKLSGEISLQDLNEICHYLNLNASEYLEYRSIPAEEIDVLRNNRIQLMEKRRIGQTKTRKKA